MGETSTKLQVDSHFSDDSRTYDRRTPQSNESCPPPRESNSPTIQDLPETGGKRYGLRGLDDDDDGTGLEAWGGERDGDDSIHRPDQEVDVLAIERGSAEMSSWIGQPAIKGSSEAMRMVLLNFCAVGTTYVPD